MKIDYHGVEVHVNDLISSLTWIQTMGMILQKAAGIWVQMIKDRLMGNETSTSGYRAELNQTMWQLDAEFVQRIGGNKDSAWAQKTEGERRIPGGYREGMITEKIEGAINFSEPIQMPGAISIGIGNIELLNNLFPMIAPESHYKLWQVLNYGTGSVAGGSPVIRQGENPQIFFHRGSLTGVLKSQTVNPGFKGREYFIQVDGTFHESDMMAVKEVSNYIRDTVKRLSYKK